MTDIQDDTADLAFLPTTLNLRFPAAAQFVRHVSMSPETALIWTLGNQAQMQVRVLPGVSIGFEFTARAFAPPQHHGQNARVFVDDQQVGDWTFDRAMPGIKSALVPKELVPPSGIITLRFEVANPIAPASLGIGREERVLGICFFDMKWAPVFDMAAFINKPYGRRVGAESRRTFDLKVRDGFWERWITGPNVLDIGFQGYEEGTEPIIPGAIGVDVNYPGYDGRTLPFADESQDTVYSSHCLEHIADYIQAIRDWYRVIKYGGHIIAVVPHAHLYERRRRPPFRNGDHKRSYTPNSLLSELDQSLPPNSYRIRHLVENDWEYDYAMSPDFNPSGCYEIELVIEKIRIPNWTVPD